MHFHMNLHKYLLGPTFVEKTEDIIHFHDFQDNYICADVPERSRYTYISY
jgi:hypothetical protein